MPDDPVHLAERLDQVAAELRQLPQCGDWVSAFASGDAVGTDFAAYVCDCSPQTIRRRASDAAATDNPLGVWFAQSVWLISLARLLDDIEKRDGRHGRLAAMSRAAKYAEMRAPLQMTAPDERAATG
jgi:hypothetical protein